ncbi:MAG: AbrB/MazE/SpoVT family DNA-binding domain-containing protein [Defluviitaleaceae bacterium]|nr:AbrB/MazE/SpoVT family DNA-binding domain-containing protein [Defluviitaleaceae bacterium]
MGAIIRTIDQLGRVVIPRELRIKLDWDVRDIIALSIKDETIIIRLVEKYYEKEENSTNAQ